MRQNLLALKMRERFKEIIFPFFLSVRGCLGCICSSFLASQWSLLTKRVMKMVLMFLFLFLLLLLFLLFLMLLINIQALLKFSDKIHISEIFFGGKN